jgi:hypothetical protein
MDSQCATCAGGASSCDVPIGAASGKCTTPPTGCTLAGLNLSLPAEIADNVTNTCSIDTDCNNVGIQISVDGFGVDVPEPVCAPIIAGCGVCVSCTSDLACPDVTVDVLGLNIPVGWLLSCHAVFSNGDGWCLP